VPNVQREGWRFDVSCTGQQDGEPVLLLHGFPQGADTWAGVAAALAGEGYRAIAPDQRGYSPGARPTGAGAYRVRELVADALAVVDALVEPGAPVHVVGHDLGALVAWSLAARHPDRVRTLTAVSVPPAAAYRRAVVSSRQALASWYVLAFAVPGLAERLLAPRRGALLARLLRRAGQLPAAAEREAARMAEHGALVAALNWYRGLLAGSRDGPEPPVRVPAQLVWSSGEGPVTRAAAELASRYVAGPFRYVELCGVNHWIPDEAPDTLAELVVEHMAAYRA
jgi:pimeloyl-ACP methyl ester carboxylesterase